MWNSGTTIIATSSSVPAGPRRFVLIAWAAKFRCVSITPLGADVVPEV